MFTEGLFMILVVRCNKLDGAHPASEAFIELVLIAYCEDPRDHNGDRRRSYR